MIYFDILQYAVNLGLYLGSFHCTSVTTHLYLSNFFFITASFHDILKETAVITYGKTKKIYYQAQ